MRTPLSISPSGQHNSASASLSSHPVGRPILLVAFALLLFSIATAAQASLSWTYNAATDVPVTANGYVASGNATLALNFAPPVGTNLTVVNNTGLGFISGTFSNLAQGQQVGLTYNGVAYTFVANYFGGSGNDLVLQWVNTTAMAWGYNVYGQLGNNSTAESNLPVAVTTSGALAGKTVTAIATESNHSLALCSDGTMTAWGYNYYGQLGNNSSTDSHVPVAVTASSGALAGKTVIAISAGWFHSVALCSDGTVATWGNNSEGQLGNNGVGQLGNGGTVDSYVPVAVTISGVLAGKTVIAVAAGSYHNLALCSDGTVASWGENLYGKLGNGSTNNSPVPVAVSSSGVLAGKTVIAIAAGANHSLALCSDGTVAAWGYNGHGELGNNSTTDSHVPVAVTASGVLAGKTVIAVAAGTYHSLALCSDGTVAAWGFGGELGNNSSTDSHVPVAVTASGVLAGKAMIAVAAGSFHSLALCSDGTLVAWGDDTFGELGDNSTRTSLVPVAVSTGTLPLGGRFVGVGSRAGANHSLAMVALPETPVVASLAAISVTDTGAVLNGTVNATNYSTAVSFEYGTTTSYGGNVVGTPSPLTNSSDTAVNATITGLTPGTTYHFRVDGVSNAGTIYGGDLSFTTLTALEGWRQTYYGTTGNWFPAADTADPFRTGVSNLEAFAFGGRNQDPALASASLLPGAQSSGGNLFFGFNQPAGVSGITYGAQWSTTLQANDWHAMTDTGSGSAHLFSVPIGSNAKLFVRLVVSEP